MKLQHFIFILLLSFVSVSAQKIKSIPGDKYISEQFRLATNKKFPILNSSFLQIRCYHLGINKDTLTTLFNNRHLAKYYNKQWNIIDNDLRKTILDKIEDTEITKSLKPDSIKISGIHYDKKGKPWYIIQCSIPDFDYRKSIVYNENAKNLYFDSYYVIDSNKYFKIFECKVFFDNNNVPYFIIHIADKLLDESYSICKLESDTLRNIHNIYINRGNMSGKITNPDHYSLKFDSNNNFYAFSDERVYYFVNDKLERTINLREQIPDEKFTVPGVSDLFVNGNDLILCNTTMTVSTLHDGKWTTDYEPRYYLEAMGHQDFLRVIKYESVLANDKLYIYAINYPFFLMVKDLKKNKWTYHPFLINNGISSFYIENNKIYFTLKITIDEIYDGKLTKLGNIAYILELKEE